MYSKVIDLILALVNKGIITTGKSTIVAILIGGLVIFPEYKIICAILFVLLILYCILSKILTDSIKSFIKSTLDEHKKDQDAKHTELIDYRRSISVKIDSKLKLLGTKVMADRVVWAEYSNSTLGFTGVPFMYFSIHNEYCKTGIQPMNIDFQKQNISNYKFINNLYDDKLVKLNSVSKIENSDSLTYYMLNKNGIEKGYFISAEVNGVRVGFLGVLYNEKNKIDETKLILEMGEVCSNISDLLKID